MESSVMQELRKIRDENSMKHLDMSEKERLEELKKSVDWLVAATQVPVEDSRVS